MNSTSQPTKGIIAESFYVCQIKHDFYSNWREIGNFCNINNRNLQCLQVRNKLSTSKISLKNPCLFTLGEITYSGGSEALTFSKDLWVFDEKNKKETLIQNRSRKTGKSK